MTVRDAAAAGPDGFPSSLRTSTLPRSTSRRSGWGRRPRTRWSSPCRSPSVFRSTRAAPCSTSPGATQIFAFTGIFKPIWIAKTKDPIGTTELIEVLPGYTFDDHPPVDIVFVPGGGGEGVSAAMLDPVYQGWLKKTAPRAQWVGSVCTGGLVVAASGFSTAARPPPTGARGRFWRCSRRSSWCRATRAGTSTSRSAAFRVAASRPRSTWRYGWSSCWPDPTRRPPPSCRTNTRRRPGAFRRSHRGFARAADRGHPGPGAVHRHPGGGGAAGARLLKGWVAGTAVILKSGMGSCAGPSV